MPLVPLAATGAPDAGAADASARVIVSRQDVRQGHERASTLGTEHHGVCQHRLVTSRHNAQSHATALLRRLSGEPSPPRALNRD
jgi:hypothetical protein